MSISSTHLKHAAGVEGCCDQQGDDRSERTREPRATLGQRQNGDCRRRGRAENISRGKLSTKKWGRSPQAIENCRSESEEIASTASFCVVFSTCPTRGLRARRESILAQKFRIARYSLLASAQRLRNIRIELAALASSSARWLHVPEAKTCARYRLHSQ